MSAKVVKSLLFNGAKNRRHRNHRSKKNRKKFTARMQDTIKKDKIKEIMEEECRFEMRQAKFNVK